MITPEQQKVVDSMHKCAETGLFSDRMLHQIVIFKANMVPMEPITEEETLREVLKLEARIKKLEHDAAWQDLPPSPPSEMGH